ncbi:autotransporter outer membrane beta-barrel domain-containing protein [Helicobacter brantae]|nr:autotransporter outer membrane beta-barrel domain-containing protein [Helicobacter brantae]
MKKHFLSAFGLFVLLQDVGLSNNIIFTGPNQTIEVTQDSGTIPLLKNQYAGNTLAFFYPSRNLDKGFKHLEFIEVEGGMTYLPLLFVLYADMNREQQIGDRVIHSDYLIARVGGFYGRVPLCVVFALGTRADSIKNAIFFTTQSNSDFAFVEIGKGYLDFTEADISITDVKIYNDGLMDYAITHATETNIIPSDEMTGLNAPLLNQTLYLAGFDYLSQRMGELRDNPYSHGVWARIVNGGVSNSLGLGLKSNYTSFQGGYDYGFEGAGFKDFLGVSFFYTLAFPTFESEIVSEKQTRIFENLQSYSTGVSVYNSYIQDEGWYNDSVLKLQYLQSTFEIYNPNRDRTREGKLGNFALSLLSEFGYRFRLAEDWYVQPQAGFGLGWIDKGSFRQSYEGSSEFLDTQISHTLILKSSFGSSFGYTLKRFFPTQKFNLSFYMGTFYEFDYIYGRDISLNTTNLSSSHHSPSLFDPHFLINLGTNIQAYESVRIYFDFEKSFFGMMTKDYQVSLGVRYSFGESPVRGSQTKSADREKGKRDYPL